MFHPEMANDNVYYINIKPYYYDLNFEYMLSKFKESEISKKIINNETDFHEIMESEFKKYKYRVIEKDLNEYEIDKILGKQIVTHLHSFFNKNKNRTVSNRSVKNKTKRKYKN